MRITPDILHKIARDTVQQRSHSERDLLAVYLQGSLLTNEPLLGGTADIDLFFIHNEAVSQEREIVRLTDDVHLDIAHHPRSLYRQARELRVHPWLGPGIYGCRVLYDPQHFMDFTQASVRGQFNFPENVIGRVRSQADHARQMWLALEGDKPASVLDTLTLYLRAVGHAANAIASLSGPPLPERRFLLRFPERARAAGHLGLYNGLIGLLGAPNVSVEALQSWMPSWKAAFESLPDETRPARFHICRLNYYLHAFEAMVKGDQPQAVLWPLLETWTQLVRLLEDGQRSEKEGILVEGGPGVGEHLAAWQAAMDHLSLSGESSTMRIAALDAYLDGVEEILENWAKQAGIE